jgi:hypothetical protein
MAMATHLSWMAASTGDDRVRETMKYMFRIERLLRRTVVIHVDEGEDKMAADPKENL